MLTLMEGKACCNSCLNCKLRRWVMSLKAFEAKTALEFFQLASSPVEF